jgi:UDP-N-acetylmuramyl pentapeptide phosphotransferase/UDP-N-acetylglucosamine-1-phosphate transferase
MVGLTLGLWFVDLSFVHRFDSLFFVFAAGGLAVAMVGWLDDVGTAGRTARFVVHSLAAAMAMLAFGYFDEIVVPFVGPIHFSWFGVPLTFLWITGLTNAYNFLDGLDGIAGGQAVVAGAGWVILGSMMNRPEIAILGALTASTSLGFLKYNWPPARIFMGDVGSSFFGYTFALIPLMCSHANSALPFASVLLVWPCLFDCCFTVIRRAKKGENILVAHRSFLFQRLNIAGWSHLQVTLLYTVLEAIGVVLAWRWTSDPNLRNYVVGIALVLAGGLWMLIILKEKNLKVASTKDNLAPSVNRVSPSVSLRKHIAITTK